MMRLAITIGESSYLESSARLRGISRVALVTRIVETVLKDQMILSVLDDGDEMAKAAPPRSRPPAPTLFRQDNPGYYVPKKRKVELTKNELHEQLTQAVVNTGGRRITMVERKAMVLDKLAKADHPLCMGEIGGASWWQATDALVADGAVRRIESPNKRLTYRGEPSVRYALVETTIRDEVPMPATGDVDA